jgi:hypothetical protein
MEIVLGRAMEEVDEKRCEQVMLRIVLFSTEI